MAQDQSAENSAMKRLIVKMLQDTNQEEAKIVAAAEEKTEQSLKLFLASVFKQHPESESKVMEALQQLSEFDESLLENLGKEITIFTRKKNDMVERKADDAAIKEVETEIGLLITAASFMWKSKQEAELCAQALKQLQAICKELRAEGLVE